MAGRGSWVACALATMATMATAQAPIDPAGLPGTRFLVGGGKAPAAVYERFLSLCGGTEARIVLIPTASSSADTEAGRDKTLATWREDHPGVHFELLHTRDRAVADDEAFCAPLRAATGVWLGGGAQELLAKAYLGTRVERELNALLARGGVVGGTSAGTAIQTRPMIQEGMDPPVIADGFDFVPGAIADQHFLVRERLPRLLLALAARPGHFGLGIDEGTAVEICGRDLRVHGRSKALLVLAAGAGREQRIVELQAGDRADLVTWQRAARDRAGEPWPPAALPTPEVEHGALVIVGGGRVPPAIVQRFVALAGGEHAKVVLVPGAMPREGRAPEPFARLLRGAGVTAIRELDCSHPREVTAEALAVLDDATAVWFGGGRQWRLCDAFDGTAAVAKFRAVLERGGVIGGSSAGATIQGGFLVRGNPLGNTDMWCEGYDRGFAFLPGCAIDQHFLARDRVGDLTALHRRLPQLTCLGIDEGTAAIVSGTTLEVVGASKVAVFAPNAAAPAWLEPGQRWSFADRQVR
ncbi:MAG: cyanophycinase [Planctomycetes bacterium]|nr:cyanophycinase [Planctomycetota bacterium]